MATTRSIKLKRPIKPKRSILSTRRARVAPLIPAGSPEGKFDDHLTRQIRMYFAAHHGSFPAPGLHQRMLRLVERPLIQLTLEATGGNQMLAARILGINRNTLRKKMDELEIEANTKKPHARSRHGSLR